MADKQTVKDLLEDEIKDLYSAEKQLTKATPKMAKGSHDAARVSAFQIFGHPLGDRPDLALTKRQCSRAERCKG